MCIGKHIVYIWFSTMPGFRHPLRVLECTPPGNEWRTTVSKRWSNRWGIASPCSSVPLHSRTSSSAASSVISENPFVPYPACASFFNHLLKPCPFLKSLSPHPPKSFSVDILAFSLTLNEWVKLISLELLQVQKCNNKVNKFATIFLCFV